MLLHWTLFIIFMSSFSILRASRTPEVKTLLCIGDSITEGIGSSDPFYNYPSQLSRLLNGDTSYNGIHYDVINLGVSSAALQKRGEQSYWNSPQFARASQYFKNASGVVILLGTNDTKVSAWNESLFYRDYSSLLNHFKGFKSRPRVYVIIPPPIFGNFPSQMSDINSSVINQHFPNRLVDFATENEVPVIDAFKAMGGKTDGSLDHRSRDLFIDDSKPITWPNDGCHPNNKGYTQLARTVFWELLNTHFKTSARKIRKRFLTKEKENGHTTTTTTGSYTAAVKDEEHHEQQQQKEELFNKDAYNQLLYKPLYDSSAAAVAKSKLQFRWKSKEEMGKTTDDFSTITA